MARSLGIDATPASDVRAALTALGAVTSGPARIVICGSLYLAGHVLADQQGLPPPRN